MAIKPVGWVVAIKTSQVLDLSMVYPLGSLGLHLAEGSPFGFYLGVVSDLEISYNLCRQ